MYQIIKRAPLFASISIAIFLLATGIFVYRWSAFGPQKALNLGIDFTGGTIMTVDLNTTFSEDSVRQQVEKAGMKNVTVNKSVNEKTKVNSVAIIRFNSSKALANNQQELRATLVSKLKTQFPKISTSSQEVKIDSIGSSVSSELIQNAIISVLMGCAAILVYVSWRFDSKVKRVAVPRLINTGLMILGLYLFYMFQVTYKNFTGAAIVTGIVVLGIIFVSVRYKMHTGLAAFFSLIHDVLLMLAVMSIFYFPLNSPFVAALLTIIGYSINDTIVTFDRIRDNESKYPIKSFSRKELANVSVNETLGRTIKTTVTVILCTLAVYIFGVESIREFALPMLFGLVSGAYSTIFIAAAIWSYWADYDYKKETTSTRA